MATANYWRDWRQARFELAGWELQTGGHAIEEEAAMRRDGPRAHGQEKQEAIYYSIPL